MGRLGKAAIGFLKTGGDPVAWQKGTRVSGKQIIMFLDEDRSVVEGDSRVIIEGEGGGKR